ncbi:MAG: ribose-5-phosphate isomerase RpiA [Bryobacteraceae bacterium]
MGPDADQLKLAAAESAIAQITEGMILGLGSGTTAELAIDALGRRVREGLHVVGIPTSEHTAAQARTLGIPLSNLDECPHIDLTIDGADVVGERDLSLIKGRGGALLREKIVASASRRLVIMIDGSKLVRRLAVSEAIPIEVVPFGWRTTARRLSDLGARPVLRMNAGGKPFMSDGGHYILDCPFQPLVAPESLAQELDHIMGVVEHGLFIGLTSEVHVAGVDGVRVLKREQGL